LRLQLTGRLMMDTKSTKDVAAALAAATCSLLGTTAA